MMEINAFYSLLLCVCVCVCIDELCTNMREWWEWLHTKDTEESFGFIYRKDDTHSPQQNSLSINSQFLFQRRDFCSFFSLFSFSKLKITGFDRFSIEYCVALSFIASFLQLIIRRNEKKTTTEEKEEEGGGKNVFFFFKQAHFER